MKAEFRGNLHVFPNYDRLSQAAARLFVARAKQAVAANGRFMVALAGGQTPIELYRILASGTAGDVPWEKGYILWSDERYVPHDSAESNYHLARETLLDHVAVPPEQIFPIPTNFAHAEKAAKAYEVTLEEVFTGGWPCFDLIVLGMGADGHCASLFPQSSTLQESGRQVVASLAPTEPQQRVTLTYPALNSADTALFLVSGESKATALARALAPETTIEACPAAGIQPRGELLWYADAAAAALLPKQGS